MKSLKRTLSLVLVLVMVLGLVGISAGASFKDEEKINYKEAVGVMTGIGALVGYPDGTFNGTGTVTREEAVKTVVYAVLGADIAKTLAGTATGFSDVDAGRWSSGVIAYAVSRGIVNGRDAKTFDPTGNVTANEVGKMMLCAAGYGAKGELVGSSWELNTAILANQTGIFADSKATNNSAPATREETALYAFNGITKVGQVEYNKAADKYDRVFAGDSKVALTIAAKVYAMKTDIALVTGSKATGETETYLAKATVNADTGLITDLATPAEFKFDVASNLVGHVVKVFYKDAKTVYSIEDAGTNIAVAKAIDNATAFKAAFGKVTAINNPHYTFTTALAGTKTSTEALNGFTSATNAGIGTYVVFGGKIVSYLAPATFVADVVLSYTAPTVNSTGKIDLAVSSDIVIPKVGDTTSATALAYAKFNIYANPAAKDVVTVHTAGNVTTLVKATMETGKVGSIDVTSTRESLKAGEKTYAKSQTSFLGTSASFADWTAANLLGKDCAFFLAPDGKVIAVKPASAATDAGLVYVYKNYIKAGVDSYGQAKNTNWIQAVDMNGKEVNYQVKENVKTDNGFLCSVSTAYDPAEKATLATFTQVATTTGTQPTTTSNAKKETNLAVVANASIIAANNYFTADTKFIYVDGNDVTNLSIKTATGAQAIPASTEYSYYSTRSSATDPNYAVKYVVVQGTPTAIAAESLIFATGAFTTNKAVPYTTAAGTPGFAYQQTVYVDGVAKVILTSGVQDTAKGDIEAGFYTFVVDPTTGLYAVTKAAASGVATGVVSNVFGNLVSVDTLTDVNAAKAFIVDVVYDAAVATGNTTVNQITSLNGLRGSTANATVFCSYTTAANGVKTITGIYVTAQPTFA